MLIASSAEHQWSFMPKWETIAYDNLTPEVRQAYDAYASAYATALQLGLELQEKADQAWTSENPNGVDGKFCSFNANNGWLMWFMSKRKKKKKRKADQGYRSEGKDAPQSWLDNHARFMLEDLTPETLDDDANPFSRDILEGLEPPGISREDWARMSDKEKLALVHRS